MTENELSEVKHVRIGANAYNLLKMSAEESKSPGLMIGLQMVVNGLKKIAERAIEIKDPILYEELVNLEVITITDDQRRELLAECRLIQPENYNYDIF